MVLYKVVISSQMLVVTISMQDKGCKMIRASVSSVALYNYELFSVRILSNSVSLAYHKSTQRVGA